MATYDLSFDELSVALGYALGATISPVESKPAPKKDDKPKKVEKPVAKKEDDDMDDLFGDEDEAPAPAAPSRAEQMAAAKADKEKSKKIERSQVVLEVKPWEAEQNLAALFAKIRDGVTMDGLKWGEGYKLADVAFGIKKLVISCIIEDEKVGLNDITDMIEAFENEVQSVDLSSMQRHG